tara:strand:+ start:2752 stop:4344 length:1593 start_codon:yes stop_codon:yes gene_type:complete
MSYSDPQQVIDRRFSIINQGVSKLLGETTDKVNNFNANQQKERDLYKKNMDKAAGKAASRASGSFNKAKAASDKFTSGLYGSTGAPTEEAVLFDDQINGIFSNWGTELNDQISAVQAAGGSEMEIAALTDKYIGKLNQFTTDIANWEAAREEFMLAKQAGIEGGPNAVGTLLSDPELQRNPELINMFTAMTDDELDNLYITIDPNGSTRISMGTITDGNFDAQSSSDISAWARNHKDSPDGKYFMTNEKFDVKDYEAMASVFKDLEDNDNLKSGGKLDKELVREYLLEGDIGRSVMDSFLLDGTSKNKWASLYPSDEISRQYNDNDYLNIIIDNAWDDLYSPTQKKGKASSTKSGKAGTSTQKTALNIPKTNTNTYTFTLPDGSTETIEKQFIPKFLEDNPDAKFDKSGTSRLSPSLKPKEENKKAATKIVKKTKNMTKDQIVNLGKEEIAKLTKQEKDKLKKKGKLPKSDYEGLPPEAYVIDKTIGYPLMAWLFGGEEEALVGMPPTNRKKEEKVPKEVIAMNKSREKV